jgi:hypothetical protein
MSKKRGLLSHLRDVPKSISPTKIDEYIEHYTYKPNSNLSVKQPVIVDPIKKYIGYPIKSAPRNSINSSSNPNIYIILMIVGIIGVIGFSLYEGNVFEGFRDKRHTLNKKRVIILLCLIVFICIISLYNI